MAARYTKDMPSDFPNRIEKVAIVGASGNIGKHFLEALVATGKHTVTALVREGSTTSLPDGVSTASINYDDEDSLTKALAGQQVLIITLSVAAAPDTESKLFQAAAKAGVPYVLPNWYAQDPTNEGLLKDTFIHAKCQAARQEIEKLGVSSWIQLTCGFWYEFSVSFGPDSFGFDFDRREVTWFDNGETKISSSTWEQCGRAMAALLSLPEFPRDADERTATLAQFCNGAVYIDSFEVSQRDIFDSVKRVTGTSDQDWTFKKEDSHERQAAAVAEIKKGDMGAYTKGLYSRIFFPDSPGNFADKIHNKILGLPTESIDQATKHAVDMAKQKAGSNYINNDSNEGRRQMVGKS